MTRRRCLSADDLAGFARGRGTEDQERHVRGCERCTRRAILVRRIVTAGIGPIEDTAAEVDDLVERLRGAPRGEWWKLVRQPEYQRADVARRLLSLAIDMRLRDVHAAVELGKKATSVADGAAGRDAAEVRFEAWKFSSAILREAGRYTEAEHALAKGEEIARLSADPELARAAMFLSRALLYAERDVWKPQEAVVLLDRAEDVYARRDEDRMQVVRTARALLSFRSGAMVAAREMFQKVLIDTSPTPRETYLDALSNLMSARVELREADLDVERRLVLLLEENTTLGRTVQVARARWLMGRVHVIRGAYETAVQLLRKAMFEIGDNDSSIRIGVDLLEALLLNDRHDDAFALALELAAAAVAVERTEPTRRHGLTSQVCTYLREAAQRQALTADLVTDVAKYLDRMMRQVPYDFIPPMPLTTM
jgi:tetratricopeptide (TPR) repeat protein